MMLGVGLRNDIQQGAPVFLGADVCSRVNCPNGFCGVTVEMVLADPVIEARAAHRIQDRIVEPTHEEIVARFAQPADQAEEQLLAGGVEFVDAVAHNEYRLQFGHGRDTVENRFFQVPGIGEEKGTGESDHGDVPALIEVKALRISEGAVLVFGQQDDFGLHLAQQVHGQRQEDADDDAAVQVGRKGQCRRRSD